MNIKHPNQTKHNKKAVSNNKTTCFKQAKQLLNLDKDSKLTIAEWDGRASQYADKTQSYRVRGKEISVDNFVESISGNEIPKVAFPVAKDWGERIRFGRLENVPGKFPFTAGVFPFKREGEDPTRLFAGEGTPERTNRRRSCRCP